VRSEVQEERLAAQASADRSVAALRERVRAAEEHAAALAAEMDAIRREGAEAQHAAAAARAEAERVLRSAAGGAPAQAEIARQRADAAALAEQLAAERRSRADAEAQVGVRADRVADMQAMVERLEGELERRIDVQRGVQEAIADLREALGQVRAQSEAQGSGARAALEELKTVAAGLRARLGELEHAERVARVAARDAGAALDARTRELSRAGAELERLRAELGAARAADEARAAAVHVAERAVEAARRQAADLQVRLDDETRRRFEAEAALRVELRNEREGFAAEVEAVERDVRARIAAERAAYEDQAAEIERLVAQVRAHLASAGEQLEARLGEAERRRDAAFAERDAALAARDAALADVAATKREIAAELEEAAAQRESLARRLAEAEAEVASARERVDAARQEAEAQLREVGGDLASRLAEAEATCSTLSAELTARDDELARLRALVEAARSGEAELGTLVEAVAAQAGAVGKSFERAVAGLSARIEAETATLRSQLDEERRARWVAEQELAAERERGASGARATVADSLARSELESMRRELADAQEQIAAERARSEEGREQREEASRLVADLGAAESRLKQREAAADPPTTVPTVPSGRGSVPLTTRVVPASRRRATPWLSRSIGTLSRTDDAAAAELLLALLPAQGGVLRDPLVYAMLVDGHGAYRIEVGPQGATVEAKPPTDVSSGTQVTVGGSIEQLAPLAAGGAPRRLRGVRISEGRRRRLRRLVRARRRPLDLAEFVERGIDLPAIPLLAALAAAVEPTWTAGHDFMVRYVLDGGDTADVVVPGDRAPTVQRAAAGTDAGDPAATVTLPVPALAALLARTELPPGAEATVAGDQHAVARLHGWFVRAQGLVSARG
jgi:hypothetical protein